jgi:hypothetical protein
MQIKYNQQRGMRQRLKELEEVNAAMAEKAGLFDKMKARAEDAESKLSDMGFEDMKKMQMQQKSKLTKVERSLARAKQDSAQYSEVKERQIESLTELVRTMSISLMEEKNTNQVMSANLVQMEKTLQETLSKCTLADERTAGFEERNAKLMRELDEQGAVLYDTQSAKSNAQKQKMAAKFVQRTAQMEVLSLKRRVAALEQEKTTSMSKLAHIQRKIAEDAHIKQQESLEEESKDLKKKDKVEAVGKQIFRGGRQVDGRYLLTQVLEQSNPFMLHVVAYQPEEAQEDHVTFDAEDLCRIIKDVSEFMVTDQSPDTRHKEWPVAIKPGKKRELLKIIFASTQAGFKQGQLFLTERARAEQEAFVRIKQEVGIFRGCIGIQSMIGPRKTSLVFTAFEEWYSEPAMGTIAPSIRFRALNPLTEDEFELTLSPLELARLAPEFLGYRASEDIRATTKAKPTPEMADLLKKQAAAEPASGHAAGRPVRHFFVRALLAQVRILIGDDGKMQLKVPEPTPLPAEPEAEAGETAPRLQGRAAAPSLLPVKRIAAPAPMEGTHLPEILTRSAKVLNREMFALVVSKIVEASQVSLRFTLINPETDEEDDLDISLDECETMAKAAKANGDIDAPEEQVGAQTGQLLQDYVKFLSRRLCLQKKAGGDVKADATGKLCFEQEVSDRERKIMKQAAAKRRNTLLLDMKRRQMRMFGAQVVLCDEGGSRNAVYLVLQVLREPFPYCVSVHATLQASQLALNLSVQEIVALGLSAPPAGEGQEVVATWCSSLAEKLVLRVSTQGVVTLAAQPPSPILEHAMWLNVTPKQAGISGGEAIVETDLTDHGAPKVFLNIRVLRGAGDGVRVEAAAKIENAKVIEAVELRASQLAGLGLDIPDETEALSSEMAARWVDRITSSIEFLPSSQAATVGSQLAWTESDSEGRAVGRLHDRLHFCSTDPADASTKVLVQPGTEYAQPPPHPVSDTSVISAATREANSEAAPQPKHAVVLEAHLDAESKSVLPVPPVDLHENHREEAISASDAGVGTEEASQEKPPCLYKRARATQRIGAERYLVSVSTHRTSSRDGSYEVTAFTADGRCAFRSERDDMDAVVARFGSLQGILAALAVRQDGDGHQLFLDESSGVVTEQAARQPSDSAQPESEELAAHQQEAIAKPETAGSILFRGTMRLPAADTQVSSNCMVSVRAGPGEQLTTRLFSVETGTAWALQSELDPTVPEKPFIQGMLSRLELVPNGYTGLDRSLDLQLKPALHCNSDTE